METGVMRVVRAPHILGNPSRVGLFTNLTGTMPDLTRNVEALVGAGVPLVALFSPEHGLWGSAQAGDSEPSAVDEASGLPVHDTYRRGGGELDALLAAARIDLLLVDLQDVGSRFYTYTWSLFDVLVSAARVGVPVTVLDRPNPIGDLGARGPGLDPACSSFVGRVGVPVIHGRTLGELAQAFNAGPVPERADGPAHLEVVELADWQRDAPLEGFGPWVAPSLNLPTPMSALLYPGTCLLEGTNASEGRGTTRPFQIVAAGYIDARLAPALRERTMPGVLVRELKVVPTFSKWAGTQVRGVELHVADRSGVDPLAIGMTLIAVLSELYQDEFRFLEPVQTHRPPHIDLLWGSEILRTHPTADAAWLLENSPTPDV